MHSSSEKFFYEILYLSTKSEKFKKLLELTEDRDLIAIIDNLALNIDNFEIKSFYKKIANPSGFSKNVYLSNNNLFNFLKSFETLDTWKKNIKNNTNSNNMENLLSKLLIPLYNGFLKLVEDTSFRDHRYNKAIRNITGNLDLLETDKLKIEPFSFVHSLRNFIVTTRTDFNMKNNLNIEIMKYFRPLDFDMMNKNPADYWLIDKIKIPILILRASKEVDIYIKRLPHCNVKYLRPKNLLIGESGVSNVSKDIIVDESFTRDAKLTKKIHEISSKIINPIFVKKNIQKLSFLYLAEVKYTHSANEYLGENWDKITYENVDQHLMRINIESEFDPKLFTLYRTFYQAINQIKEWEEKKTISHNKPTSLIVNENVLDEPSSDEEAPILDTKTPFKKDIESDEESIFP